MTPLGCDADVQLLPVSSDPQLDRFLGLLGGGLTRNSAHLGLSLGPDGLTRTHEHVPEGREGQQERHYATKSVEPQPSPTELRHHPLRPSLDVLEQAHSGLPVSITANSGAGVRARCEHRHRLVTEKITSAQKARRVSISK